jgi:hypothetical protein
MLLLSLVLNFCFVILRYYGYLADVPIFILQLQVTSLAIRSGQVILLLTDIQSIIPSWPRAPNCDSWPCFSLDENFVITLRGAFILMGGRGCHVQGLAVSGQSIT